MSFRVEYAAQRGEIWAWYWRNWRKHIWKVHLTLFIIVSGLVASFLSSSQSLSSSSISIALACGFLAVAWMPVYPLLMFKPEVRSVEIDEDGISTAIGDMSARRSWDEIQSISQEGGYIVMLGRTGSAFLIPPRAFETADDQQRFLSFALQASLTRPN